MTYIQDDEQRARIARHFGGLGSPVFWHDVVELELRRVENLQETFATTLHEMQKGTPEPVIGGYLARAWYPGALAVEAALLLLAIHNAVEQSQTFIPHTSGVKAQRAILRQLAPRQRLNNMRNGIEHSNRQVQERDIGLAVEFEDESDFGGELLFRVGADEIKLKATARAALELTRRLDEQVISSMNQAQSTREQPR